MEIVLYYIKKCIPTPLFRFFQPSYHFILAFLSACIYRFPSRNITVVAITGTKGKSSVAELVTKILEESGNRTALLSTIRFQIGDESQANKYKMTMPGRFFVQKFLREAVKANCRYAVIEMTSEGARFFRHRWVAMDALIFTNLSPEHIESHGSFENYVAAKLSIAHALSRSSKRPRAIISNSDDEYGPVFLETDVEHKVPYSLKDLDLYTLQKDGVNIVLEGVTIRTALIGLFNVYNMLAAIAYARTQNIDLKTIQRALEKISTIKGRVEFIEPRTQPKPDFSVVVDYAHTTDSLTKLYESFKGQRRICVLGNTGGGRDTWKRPEMAHIAEEYCDRIILANEDPYDEDPMKILEDMMKGIGSQEKAEIILDRRKAINRAISYAEKDDVVLITGKGTDPYIMGRGGSKSPWSDARVAAEELDKVLKGRTDE